MGFFKKKTCFFRLQKPELSSTNAARAQLTAPPSSIRGAAIVTNGAGDRTVSPWISISSANDTGIGGRKKKKIIIIRFDSCSVRGSKKI
jgi:hypothetical protein